MRSPVRGSRSLVIAAGTALLPLTTFLLFLNACSQSSSLPQLRRPVQIEAGGVPIEADIGHAAPFVWDVNKDGRKDLLVGQFGTGETSGRCRVYLNVGTDAAPVFEDYTFLQAGGEDAAIFPS